MAYVALYRKFRPETFEEVRGQEAIVTTLKNQMIHDRVGHAYLFCGTRGTGKTSVAKLLAKAVNCDNPVNGSPCGECASCKRIASGSAMNVIEIDAASNNGVDNIRDINDSVQYAPAEGKKLVYIIDEVHMLSSGAFNALLKTLEEPPAYVVFILATTELHKVPVTIKSRCQRYDFRRIPYGVIADRMQEILEHEGTAADREALDYIARAADGSMRDALSLLDQCVSYNLGERLTLDMALSAIGAVDIDLFLRLENGIAADDTNGVMETISEVVWRGTELTRFTEDFGMFLRNVLFLKLSPGLGKTLDMPSESIEELKKLGEKLTEDTLQRQIRVIQELLPELRLSTIKRITLEMGMLRLMRPETDTDLTGVLARLDRLETRAERTEAETKGLEAKTEQLLKNPVRYPAEAPGAVTGPKKEIPEEDPETVINRTYPPAKAAEIIKLAEIWNNRIVPEVEQPLRGYLKQVFSIRPRVDQNDEATALCLYVNKTEDGGAAGGYFSQPENVERLEEELGRITGRKIKVEVINTPDPNMSNGMPDLAAKVNFPDIEIVN